jgi:hypothetical protein
MNHAPTDNIKLIVDMFVIIMMITLSVVAVEKHVLKIQKHNVVILIFVILTNPIICMQTTTISI